MSRIEISEFAAAKINLNLQVGALDHSGYHPVDSMVDFADVGDRLSFVACNEISLKITGPFAQDIPAGPENLVLKAAYLLRQYLQTKQGAKITLCKNLPSASGIGGGSADAAAVLRGLNRLWLGGQSIVELAALGASLGADIPACVYSRALHMSGYGEQIQLRSDPSVQFGVLVNPKTPSPTAKVFAIFDQLDRPVGDLACQNDLTAAAIKFTPQIGDVLRALEKLDECKLATMCGSGATCIGLFNTWIAAQSAAKLIAKANPNWWVQACHIGGCSSN